MFNNFSDTENYSPDSLKSRDSPFGFTKHLLSTSQLSEDSLENHLTRDLNPENDVKCDKQGDEDPMGYLDREVFPVLLPCFEDMLFAAKEKGVLKVQKSRFNGLDYLAELLWNRNPLHPERQKNYVPIFDIPFAKDYLESHPRPIYPKSWLWTPTEAALVIQSAVRGYFVRRQPEVQELRQFWKVLAEERQNNTETLSRSGSFNYSRETDL